MHYLLVINQQLFGRDSGDSSAALTVEYEDGTVEHEEFIGGGPDIHKKLSARIEAKAEDASEVIGQSSGKDVQESKRSYIAANGKGQAKEASAIGADGRIAKGGKPDTVGQGAGSGN